VQRAPTRAAPCPRLPAKENITLGEARINNQKVRRLIEQQKHGKLISTQDA
jgi:hypothetical protein